MLAAITTFAGCSASQVPGTNAIPQDASSDVRGGRHEWLYTLNMGGNDVTAYHNRGSKVVVTIPQAAPAAMTFGEFGRIFIATDGAPGFVGVYGMRHGDAKGKITDGIDGPMALVTAGAFLFVGNSNASGSYVSAYRQRDLQRQRFFDRTTGPITGLAVDSRGDVYVANMSVVRVFTQTGKLVRTVSKGITCAGAMIFDSGGQLYVANYVNGAPHCRSNITVYDVGTNKLRRIFSQGLAGPVAMTFEDTQELWVANSLNNTVAAYSESGKGPDRIISKGISSPTGVAITIFGTLFVSSAGSGTGWISVYDPGDTAPFRTITDGVNDPIGLELI